MTDAGPGHATSGCEVRERLLAEHERLEHVFRQVLSAFEEDDRAQVCATWTRFDADLLAHMRAEEDFLIPPLSRVDANAARSIVEEHGRIRTRLTELGARVDLHIVRLETTQTFIEELRAHAKHEDKLLYRWADEHPEAFNRTSFFAALSGTATVSVTGPAGARGGTPAEEGP